MTAAQRLPQQKSRFPLTASQEVGCVDRVGHARVVGLACGRCVCVCCLTPCADMGTQMVLGRGKA